MADLDATAELEVVTVSWPTPPPPGRLTSEPLSEFRSTRSRSKAGSDDVRDSPAVALAQAVIEEGGLPVAYDLLATRISDRIRRVDEPIEAVKGAAVVGVVVWVG